VSLPEPRLTPAGAGRRIANGCAILLLAICPARAADVSVLGVPWTISVGAAHLQAGAGSEFESPIVSDVHVAFLSITNTGGASWNLRISRTVVGDPLPAGVVVSLKRGGGSAEAGISDGLTYQPLTDQTEAFFSGTGDYESVEILVRLDGITTQTIPDLYSLTIRYSVVEL
jgi:hypothetical protein